MPSAAYAYSCFIPTVTLNVKNTSGAVGCIRFDNDVIRRLAGLLPNGAPIDVV